MIDKPAAPVQMFDLKGTHNPNRWNVKVEPRICVGPPDYQFLFGGVGMATAVKAMERTTERPVIWATAQYLSYARPPSIVDLDVVVPVSGKYNSQARVIGYVGEREIFTVNAALGERPGEDSYQWAKMPEAPRPEDCQPHTHWRGSGHEHLHSHIESRQVKGRFGDERLMGGVSDEANTQMWARPTDPAIPVDSAFLAIVADFVPSGIGNALGKNAGGNSLDNTIRIRRIVPTEWVFLDIQIQGIHSGFGHGRIHIFAQDGELMATASQSLIVRIHDER